MIQVKRNVYTKLVGGKARLLRDTARLQGSGLDSSWFTSEEILRSREEDMAVYFEETK